MKKVCLIAAITAAFFSCSVNNPMPKMLVIPSGVFVMGSAEGDYDEAPVHEVWVDSFRMSSCEITNAQYEAFDKGHKREFSAGDNDAVVNVTWEEAEAYCKWLSERTGKNYRLPTEAEWEYACRAGTSTPYYTGNSLPSVMQKEQATNRDLKPVDLTVGQTTPNNFGLYDMHGNVEEWCQD